MGPGSHASPPSWGFHVAAGVTNQMRERGLVVVCVDSQRVIQGDSRLSVSFHFSFSLDRVTLSSYLPDLIPVSSTGRLFASPLAPAYIGTPVHPTDWLLQNKIAPPPRGQRLLLKTNVVPIRAKPFGHSSFFLLSLDSWSHPSFCISLVVNVLALLVQKSFLSFFLCPPPWPPTTTRGGPPLCSSKLLANHPQTLLPPPHHHWARAHGHQDSQRPPAFTRQSSHKATEMSSPNRNQATLASATSTTTRNPPPSP